MGGNRIEEWGSNVASEMKIVSIEFLAFLYISNKQ